MVIVLCTLHVFMVNRFFCNLSRGSEQTQMRVFSRRTFIRRRFSWICFMIRRWLRYDAPARQTPALSEFRLHARDLRTPVRVSVKSVEHS